MITMIPNISHKFPICLNIEDKFGPDNNVPILNTLAVFRESNILVSLLEEHGIGEGNSGKRNLQDPNLNPRCHILHLDQFCDIQLINVTFSPVL